MCGGSVNIESVTSPAARGTGSASTLALLSLAMLLVAAAEASSTLISTENGSGLPAALRSAATLISGIGLALVFVMLVGQQVPPSWRTRWVVGLTLAVSGYVVSQTARWVPNIEIVLTIALIATALDVAAIVVISATRRTAAFATLGGLLSLIRVPLHKLATEAFLEGNATGNLTLYHLWSSVGTWSSALGAILLAIALGTAAWLVRSGNIDPES